MKNNNYIYGRYNNARIKRLKVRNRMIAIAVAAALGVGGCVLSKIIPSGKNNEVYANPADPIVMEDPNYVPPTFAPTMVPEMTPTPTVVPTEVPVISYQNGYNQGDSIIATDNVNMRIGTSTDAFKMDVLSKGSVVDRILTDGEWDLIRNGDQIAYVHSDYTRANEVDYNNDYYHMEPYNDICYATTGLYFRLGPSKSEKDLFMLNKDEEVIVIGKSISNTDPNDVWYLAKARGKIGFLKASYTRSLREELSRYYPDMNNLKVQKYAFAKYDSSIYSHDFNSSKKISQYQMVEILQEEGDYYLVNYDGKVGYMYKNDVKTIKGTFIAVDISTQRIYFYYDKDLVLKGRVTTGADASPTELGFYDAQSKKNYHFFGPDHNNVESHILFMSHNPKALQALHDAPWEPDEKFGDPEYRKRHGSAGCVRLPDEEAHFVYDNGYVGIPVLIKH